MVYYLNFFLINFILDFAIIEMLNCFFRLSISKAEIFLISIFSTFPSLIYIFYRVEYFFFVFLKIIDYMILSLLLTDKYSVRRVFEIYFILLLSMFSVFGFGEFFTLFVRNVIYDIFSIKLTEFYNLFIIFALFLYIFILVAIFGNLTKKRNLKSFLFDVSFFLFGKHIKITGFLDSGNTLYDTKTGKCVVIVSLSGLRRYLTQEEYNNLLLRDYQDMDINELECMSIGDVRTYIPIIDIGEIKVSQDSAEKTKTFKCVIGITNETFSESEGYECLLHREFL